MSVLRQVREFDDLKKAVDAYKAKAKVSQFLSRIEASGLENRAEVEMAEGLKTTDRLCQRRCRLDAALQ